MQIWQTKLKELYDLGQYDQKQFLDEYLDIIPVKDRDSKRGRVKRQVEKFKLNSKYKYKPHLIPPNPEVPGIANLVLVKLFIS